MKTILSILFLLIGFCINGLNAQDKTVSTNLVWQAKGGAGDTIKGTASNIYSIYVNAFCEHAKLQVKAIKTSGTATEGTFVIAKSMDFVNWVTVQTLTLTSNTTTAARYVTSLDSSDIKAPYVRVTATGTGSNATMKITYSWLIERK